MHPSVHHFIFGGIRILTLDGIPRNVSENFIQHIPYMENIPADMHAHRHFFFFPVKAEFEMHIVVNCRRRAESGRPLIIACNAPVFADIVYAVLRHGFCTDRNERNLNAFFLVDIVFHRIAFSVQILLHSLHDIRVIVHLHRLDESS